ncbi:MAG TPA: gamma-glutamyltransferase [Rhizomicrobium sp.]|nr:gamma-glutamyltransferase [Rhizomicrobium sp.]
MLPIHRLAGIAGLVFLTACSSDSDQPAASLGGGYVVGDEPFAVNTGASILAQGGSAADAATAMYFAMVATYPVAAGLGGGGVCVVHDQASGQDEAFEFLARDAAGGGAFAMPGNVRGFAALQTAYGRLPWQRDVSPGEGYAATGFPISRALSARLVSSQDLIRLDAGLASEFLDESGKVKSAGAVVSNTALAETLAAIRVEGSNGFYRGPVAQKIASYAPTQGGTVSLAELDAYAAHRESARVVPLGDALGYMPPDRVGSGTFASALLSQLVDAQGNVVASENPGTTAEATKTTLEKFGIAALPKDLGATGFAALDNNGQAVACAVTMNGPFGSDHTVPGTGVTLARAPSSGSAGLSAAFLTPVIATQGRGGAISLAGAGAGGPNGTAAIAYALVKLAHGQDMTQQGVVLSTGIAPYDTVNVIACQGGTCATLPDPGASGLGAAAGNTAGNQ